MSYTVTVLTDWEHGDDSEVQIIHSHHETGRVTARKLSEFGNEYSALYDALDAILALPEGDEA